MISVVIPAFNEEKRIEKTARDTYEYLSRKCITFEIVIVNDGSKDKTLDILHRLQCDLGAVVVNLQTNRGKGFAIRSGIDRSNYENILICDADGSTPIHELENLLHYSSKDLVIGSRYLDKSFIKTTPPFSRLFVGNIASLFSRIILRIPYKDVRCGFKLIRKSAWRQVGDKLTIDRFGYDTELVVAAIENNLKIQEVPVEWHYKRGSTLRLHKDIISGLGELFKIRKNLSLGNYQNKESYFNSVPVQSNF